MRKHVFILILSVSFIFGCFGVNNVTKDRFQEIKNACLRVPDKVYKVFNYIAENIELLISRKGIIKALLIIIPICCAYSYFFSFGPIEALLNKISLMVLKASEGVGKVQGARGFGYQIGQSEALLTSFYEYPWKVMRYIFIGGFRNSIVFGIPLLSGLMCKNFFKLS